MQRLSEERAAAVWQRAAELQAEASKRSEAAAPPLQLLAAAEGSIDPEAGFRVADVRAAAAQAGISAEFVSLALAESEGVDARGFSGATVSYRALAERVGRPKASRAVGRANATNPLPIVVPCHRVIGADGMPTGYAGGIGAKTMLLALEAGR